MARLKGPVWKVSRRLDFSVLETGEELVKRQYAPGQHGPNKRVKLSNYGLQLREKQRIRYLYNMNEKQFYTAFIKAQKMPGVTGTNFLVLLESRLDNLVYRMTFARTRRAARQLVSHGHILVNGKKVDVPSYLCSVGDVIAVREASRDLKVIKESLESVATKYAWVEVDAEKKCGKYIREVERKELPQDITESQIVEFYNRKL